MNTTISFLEKRRSTVAKKMRVGIVKKKDLDTILRVGLRVPDHGALKPWRLKLIQGKMRRFLDENIIFKEFKRLNPEASEKILNIERNRFQRAHTIVTVVSTPVYHKKIPKWEQVLSAGAVCSNILYSAQALGYAAQWLTEWYAYNHTLIKALDIDYKKQKIAGFIYIGKKSFQPKERARPDINTILQNFNEIT